MNKKREVGTVVYKLFNIFSEVYYMRIPIPCKLGDSIMTKKGLKILCGVSWFQWTDGIEFTYFYENSEKRGNKYFEYQKNPEYETSILINDSLLQNELLIKKSYPIKGRGYLYGLQKINGNLFAEIILTNVYFSHIYVQCNEDCAYVDGGEVLVPPSWDTKEKQYSIILKKYSNIKVSCI